jgi:hypothetical protein
MKMSQKAAQVSKRTLLLELIVRPSILGFRRIQVTCHICPEAELRQITVDGLLVRFNFEVWSFMEAFPHAVKDGCAAFFGDAQKSVDALSPDLFENRLVVRIWNLLAAPWPPSVVSLYSATECRFSSNAGTSFGSPWVKRWLTVHPLVPGWLS